MLTLECEVCGGDSLVIDSTPCEGVSIRLFEYGYGEQGSVFLDRDKALALRDWLTEYLK